MDTIESILRACIWASAGLMIVSFVACWWCAIDIVSTNPYRRATDNAPGHATMYKILGFDEEFTTCDCCGKSDLKGTFTVLVSDADGGAISSDLLHYGSVCVTRHTGRNAATVRKEARDATEARRLAAVAEVKAHPSYAAYDAKMNEAHKLGLFGLDFMDHCREARAAQHAAQMEISKRTGFNYNELH